MVGRASRRLRGMSALGCEDFGVAASVWFTKFMDMLRFNLLDKIKAKAEVCVKVDEAWNPDIVDDFVRFLNLTAHTKLAESLRNKALRDAEALSSHCNALVMVSSQFLSLKCSDEALPLFPRIQMAVECRFEKDGDAFLCRLQDDLKERFRCGLDAGIKLDDGMKALFFEFLNQFFFCGILKAASEMKLAESEKLLDMQQEAQEKLDAFEACLA